MEEKDEFAKEVFKLIGTVLLSAALGSGVCLVCPM